MPVNLQGAVETGFFRGLEAVECDLDPVITAFVDAGFPQGIFRQRLMDHDCGFAVGVGRIAGEVEIGVFARVVFADYAG